MYNGLLLVRMAIRKCFFPDSCKNVTLKLENKQVYKGNILKIKTRQCCCLINAYETVLNATFNFVSNLFCFSCHDI